MKNRQLVIHGVGAGVLVTLSALAWVLCFAPAVNASGNYHALLGELSAAKARQEKAAADVRALGAQIHALRTDLDGRPLLLLPADGVSQRLQQIADLAREARVELDTQEAGRQETFDRYGTVELQLAGRCGAGALRTFLAALSRQLPDVAVVSIDMSGRYAPGGTVPSVALKLQWYTAARALAAGHEGRSP
jgi:hypothetical protein